MNATLENMFHEYRMNDATNYFCAGYPERANDNARVFVSIIPADEMGAYLTLGKKSSSHGGGAVIRYQPTTSQKVDMQNRFGAFAVCTVAELKAKTAELKESARNGEIVSATTGKQVKAGALGNGHALEWYICQRWGIEWEFDNASHTICGDITKDGVEYQVKYINASL